MDPENDITKNSCRFCDIQDVEKPTISGQIVDALPYVKKSRTQSNAVIIFHCHDVSPHATNASKKFKIYFFADVAEKMWSSKLGMNDYIAIREAVAFKDFAYSYSDLFYENILVITSLSNLMERVFVKKNEETEWISFKNFLEKKEKSIPPRRNKRVEEQTERPEEIVSSSNNITSPTGDEATDSDIGIISSSDWLMAKKTNRAPLNEPDNDKSERPAVSQLNENSNLCCLTYRSPSKTPSKKPFPDSSPSKTPLKKQFPESLMQGIIRCQPNNSEKNATSQPKGVYTKLGNIRDEMVANIIVVVTDLPKIPLTTQSKKYCSVISVVDDTKPEGLRIRVFFKNKDNCPILLKYCVILCHDVKFSKSQGELMGSIHNIRHIITFEKDNTMVYKQSDYDITPDDKERVDLLRNWMFENISEARPFTPLACIVNKNQDVNLRCQIVDWKAFDKNIIVLRVSDGTTCEVPFYRVPFTCECWQSALSEAKSNRKPSKEIDIIVSIKHDHIYKKFKHLMKAGMDVELLNVSLKLMPDSVKTKPGNSLKAILVGSPENINFLQSNEIPRVKQQSNPTPEKKPVSHRKVIRTKSRGPIARITNKRRLFEHSPKNESVDSDEADFEKSLDMFVVSRKKSKSVAESNDQILDSPSTSSSSKSREKSNTITIQDDVVSNDNLRTNIDSDNDREQPVDVLSNINSAVIVQTSRSTELVQYISSMDSQLDTTIALNNAAREEAAAKSVLAHLHQSFKSVVATERKEIQKRVTDYTTKNDVSDYFMQWPSDPGNDAFYIQVTIMSTIPFINGKSSDFELLSLISGYCERCDSFFPFYLSKWIVSDDDGAVSICPKCKEKDVFSSLRQELLCELLLSDEYGNSMPGIVMGQHAANFFGCTVSQLCLSAEAKIRVRTFIDTHMFAKGKEKKPLIVKVIRIFSEQNQVYKYHILS